VERWQHYTVIELPAGHANGMTDSMTRMYNLVQKLMRLGKLLNGLKWLHPLIGFSRS
jgi:hypothetical protein